MPSVTEHIREEITETSATDADRRHGIKLVSCQSKAKPSRFRIDVEDGLLSKGIGKRKPVFGTHGMPKSDQPRAIGSVVFLAALAGLAIGLFIGRRRDD